MMQSSLIQMAEEIAEMISGLEIDGAAPAAQVDLAPDIDIAKIRERRIYVMPQNYARANSTRNGSAVTAKINIGWFEKIKISDAGQRIAAMEMIGREMERKYISAGIITAVEFEPVYDAALLRNTSVFLSICTVTVKVIK